MQFQAGMSCRETQALIKAKCFRSPLVGSDLHQVTAVLACLVDGVLDERGTDSRASLI
jgi:hypothetical protein